MFRLKQATVALVWFLGIQFGLYLPDLYIKPAQGHECYVCEQCNDVGQNVTCPAGAEYTIRYCGFNAVAESPNKNSCDEPMPMPLFTPDNTTNISIPSTGKTCFCKKDSCQPAPTPGDLLIYSLSALLVSLGLMMM